MSAVRALLVDEPIILSPDIFLLKSCSAFHCSCIINSLTKKTRHATLLEVAFKPRTRSRKLQLFPFMMTKFTLLSTILFLVPFATCHFELKYPPSRAGDDSEKQGTFPCGGYDTVKDRTQFPLSDGSIQLELGHDRSLVQVLLALGNEPGDNFNIVWKPIVQQEGPGEFCLQDLVSTLLLSFFP